MRKITAHIICILIICIVFIFTQSCEKSINYQISKTTSTTVLYAFPMPDSLILVHSSYSENIISTSNYKNLQDATITAKINNKVVHESSYQNLNEWHNTNAIAQVNDSIFIMIEKLDGITTYGATSIPEATKIINLDTLSIKRSNNQGNDETLLKINLQINDVELESNYYQIKIESIKDSLLFDNSLETIYSTVDFSKDDKVFSIRNDESFLFPDTDFQGIFSDYIFNGNSYVVELSIPENYLNNNNILQNKLVIYLYSLTEEYYNFFRTSIIEETYRDFPIQEPYNIYSNVNNGVGVVAGLSFDTDTITLKE